ncbi:DNA-deoxyinosine glycosylase [Flavobacterium sp.]|uniref:DNA-deoxyinosine glycosylase n=1 Tax=Flavobacterium sp. TaxID=239 RepID=UPI00391A913D
MKIYAFPSISSPTAKILILGTMPGEASLRAKEYYGHPRNHFWKFLFNICQQPFSTDYETKKNLLLQNNMALWDVLQACERQGSLDSAIVKEVPNDFVTFLKVHPNITNIYFNGQKAAHFFNRYVQTEHIYTMVTLPSTSPANAGMSFEKKLAIWQEHILKRITNR